MVRAVVVFESMYGNTEQVARAIAEGLAGHLPVETVEVSSAPESVTEEVLLVVGGPTHAFSMSRARTRQDAAARASVPMVSPGSGVREWLERLTVSAGHPLAASFDTKVARPRLPGSAAGAIERALRDTGCRVVQPAEHFLVHGSNGPLQDGELDRARAFGEDLGALAAGETQAAEPQRKGAAGRGVRHTVLAALSGLMAIGAVAGSVGLLNGADDFFGTETATIYSRLPFDSPQFAGVALLLSVALPLALTAVLAWRGSRHAAAAGAAAGTVLVGWIVVQLALIGTFFWLQPVCVAVGLTVTYLAMTLTPRAEAATRHTRSHAHPQPGR